MSDLAEAGPEHLDISPEPDMVTLAGEAILSESGEVLTHIIPLSDGPLVVREVRPEEDSKSHNGNLVIMHGLSQLAHEGPSAALQEVLANKHPDRRLLAIETDNMGKFSDGLSLKDPSEIAAYTLEKMAGRRVEFLAELGSEDSPTTLVTTSMGSVITILALEIAKREGIDLHLDNVVFNDSAIVTENRVRTLLTFPLHMVPAVAVEFIKSPPQKAKEMLQVGKQAASSIGGKDLLAMVRQTHDLMFGSSHPDNDKLLEILASYPDTNFVFLSGIADPLRTPGVYSYISELLKEKGPCNVHVKSIGYAGHGRAVNFRRAASDISNVLAKYDPSYHRPQLKLVF